MLHVFSKIPFKVGLGFSGGKDSAVILDFLLNKNSKDIFKNRDITLFHINHGTDHGKEAEEFVKHISEKHSLKLNLHKISQTKPKKESWEEFWRNERYNFFHSFDFPIITGHHLQDVIETYLLSSLRGEEKLIKYQNRNVIRPFLLTSRSEIDNWCIRKNVEFIQDQSNFENVHDRNIVRNEMLPIVLKLNPGIEKTIRKKLKKVLYGY